MINPFHEKEKGEHMKNIEPIETKIENGDCLEKAQEILDIRNK